MKKLNSVYTTLGASNHTEKERQENDFYATNPIAIDALMDDGGVTFDLPIWECAAGNGALSKRLEERGCRVKSTDLFYRGYGVGGVDFLKCEDKWEGDILTNPPYKYAMEFVEKAIDLVEPGNRVFMFLKLQFLEGQKRKELFKRHPLKCLYVSSSRIQCAKDGDFDGLKSLATSAIAYGWFEWEKGYEGSPTIKWIN